MLKTESGSARGLDACADQIKRIMGSGLENGLPLKELFITDMVFFILVPGAQVHLVQGKGLRGLWGRDWVLLPSLNLYACAFHRSSV